MSKNIEETTNLVKAAFHEVKKTINAFDLPFKLKVKVLRSVSVATVSAEAMTMQGKQELFADEYKSSLFDLENMDRIKNPAEKVAVYRD